MLCILMLPNKTKLKYYEWDSKPSLSFFSDVLFVLLCVKLLKLDSNPTFYSIWNISDNLSKWNAFIIPNLTCNFGWIKPFCFVCKFGICKYKNNIFKSRKIRKKSVKRSLKKKKKAREKIYPTKHLTSLSLLGAC